MFGALEKAMFGYCLEEVYVEISNGVLYTHSDVFYLKDEYNNLFFYKGSEFISNYPAKYGTIISKSQLTIEEIIKIKNKESWDTLNNQYIPSLEDYMIGQGAIKKDIEIKRVWSMPNKNTFDIGPIRDLLFEEIEGGLGDFWLDLFANTVNYDFYIPGVITNDLNPNFQTDYNMEAEDLCREFQDNCLAGVILDWPYSPRQIKECYENIGLESMLKGGKKTRSTFWSEIKNEVARIVRPGGKVISFGWNSNGMGRSRGFIVKRILMVNHGGFHNDTICTVEIKLY